MGSIAPRLVPPPPVRRMGVPAADPLLEGLEDNTSVLRIPFEKDLKPGPVGDRVRVIDYDPRAGLYYEPVNLDDPSLLAQEGLAPSESDPRFHQQMVYAVVMETLERFEVALGRRAYFGGPNNRRSIEVFPHGARDANAWYDPQRGHLVFGSFRADRKSAGRNLPGAWVHTCLSHDVVAHEATHALLHGLRPRSLEPTGPDALAFHEAFADLVALLQRFRLPGVVEQAIRRSARLDEVAPLFQIGRQFGEALGMRAALRTAIGSPCEPQKLARTHECHDRGAILLAAVFDAFGTIYRHRTRDLLRIASNGTGVLPAGELAPDLVGRLAEQARKSASHLLTMSIRAVDYCPPLDIGFGDFLRALITADLDLVPDDTRDYRGALIAAFRDRGIYPTGVSCLSEDALRWPAMDGAADITGIDFDKMLFDRPPREAPDADRKREYWREVEKLVRRNAKLFGFDEKRAGEIETRSVQPAWRMLPTGRVRHDLVVQAYQPGGCIEVMKKKLEFEGACTVVIGGDEGPGVRYAISRSTLDAERKARQAEYAADLLAGAPPSARELPWAALGLKHVHAGWWS